MRKFNFHAPVICTAEDPTLQKMFQTSPLCTQSEHLLGFEDMNLHAEKFFCK